MDHPSPETNSETNPAPGPGISAAPGPGTSAAPGAGLRAGASSGKSATPRAGERPSEEIGCPACGKLNERSASSQPDVCTRCACELGSLWKIRDAALAFISSGRARLARRDYLRAAEDARTSWELKPSEASARLAFLSCLGCRDFKAATLWYRRARGALGSARGLKGAD